MGPGAQRQAARLAAKSEALSAIYAGLLLSAVAPRQFRRRAERKALKASAAADRKAVIANRRKKGKA